VSRWHEKQLARLSKAVESQTQTANVARGGAMAFAILITSAGLTYLSQIIIARIVGATSYGYYAYVLAWTTLLAYVSALGFDVALLRFVSAYRSRENWDLLRGVVRYAQRRVYAASAVLVGLGISILLIGSKKISPELRDTFLVGFPLIPVLALLWVRCAFLRANDLVILPLVSSLIVRDAVLITIVIFAGIALGWRPPAQFVMMAMLIGAGLGLLTASRTTGRLLFLGDQDVEPTYEAKVWRRAAFPLLIIGAVDVLMNRAGVLYLGWIGEIKDAGIFSLAFNIALLVAIPRTALNTLFAPAISRLFDRKDHAQLQELVTKSTILSLGAAVFIAIGLLFTAQFLFGWFGDSFIVGVPALQVLLIGQVIIAGAGSQLPIMTMTGNERAAVVLILIGAAINVAATAILTLWLGMIGAALAGVGSLIIWNILMTIFIWRRLRLLPGLLAIFVQPNLITSLTKWRS
jgi:O-antigen/teichoic acid export membrane protein